MRPLNNILVTGGAGFMGSAFIRYLMRDGTFRGHVVNLDALTYAANLESLKALQQHPRYHFMQGNILDQPLIEKLFEEYEIDAVAHFAAESHVDRSIAGAYPFIETNVKGTLSLLEAIRKMPHIHLHHVSTDEVYGSLGESGSFTERSPYRPNSPYSASKAASDHLVLSFVHTHGISATLSHSSNNYGPWQYPEKFIPLMILNCLKQKILPVYGRGANVRDWIYVDDHAAAIWTILQHGKRGETYNIGSGSEKSNLELLRTLIELVASEKKQEALSYHPLIRFVADRPGHDFRYAIDTTKIAKELGWKATVPLQEGLKRTVRWYLSQN